MNASWIVFIDMWSRPPEIFPTVRVAFCGVKRRGFKEGSRRGTVLVACSVCVARVYVDRTEVDHRLSALWYHLWYGATGKSILT